MAIIVAELTGDVKTEKLVVGGEATIIAQELNGDIEIRPVSHKYTGDYEFTPSDETQTIYIEGKVATQDITINPIPETPLEISMDNWDRIIACMIYMTVGEY